MLRVALVVRVGVGSRLLQVLGRGGVEGRVPSLMTSAVESEASRSNFFSFIFDVLFISDLLPIDYDDPVL